MTKHWSVLSDTWQIYSGGQPDHNLSTEKSQIITASLISLGRCLRTMLHMMECNAVTNIQNDPKKSSDKGVHGQEVKKIYAYDQNIHDTTQVNRRIVRNRR